MLPEIPARCTHCLAYAFDQPQNSCQVCRDQAMSESYLCNIVRRSSSSQSFKCHAFRTNLTLVGKEAERGAGLSVCQEKEAYFADVVRSFSAGRCSDGGGCGNPGCQPDKNGETSKFHVVWVARQRKPLFAASSRFVSFLHDVFLSCGRLMAGKVLLLWLAADHLHLYLECAAWEHESEIMEDMQGLVHDALVQEFSGLEKEYGKTMIWERDFFLEEIAAK